ncbi:hypothetical protein O9H85_26195 [Paenibacillus filicis]|uniref:Uncharacterized protein n=1 Tax=Paenibacillus gyeongsangnamensis TaxID=3388067 RepID=A0ABT4QG28_9BACL|nr:hypothetical protein [Paenibacillus filicis]MCZ8515838.1 hypothetical protein [Paenibacillus filicis]
MSYLDSAKSFAWQTHRQVDEVKVFETFGGDLPVTIMSRKSRSKMSGRPGRQDLGRINARPCSLTI